MADVMGTSQVTGIINDQLQRAETALNQEVPKYTFDKLKLYFGADYKINDFIVLHQPTIQDMIDNGEVEVYSSMSPFLANSTTYRLSLWDAGIDWNKIDDYQFFCLTRSLIVYDKVRCIFGDLDITKLHQTIENDQLVFKNDAGQTIIDAQVYDHMASYLRYMFNSYPKTEKAKGKSTKQDLILEDRIMQNKRKREHEEDSSSLLSMISFCLNHPGFKYKKNELKEVTLVEFMDSVQRLNIYESTSALYKGMYSGFMDTKKIDKNDLNFMREISHA